MMFRRKNRVPIFIGTIFILLSLIYILGNYGDFYWMFSYSVFPINRKILLCYENNTNNNLEELGGSRVRLDKSIFFIETTCHDKVIDLNARQACAIESAALQNPELDVYLLFPSPIEAGWETNAYIRELLTYDNINLRHININKFFVDTPLNKKWKDNRAGLKTSLWPQSHASDVLRYTLLWKYGGFYIDLDVILLKPFGPMVNFAGAESPTAVAAGVISVTHGGLVADLCINDIKENFKGNDWGNNGPGVITRVAKKLCNKQQVKDMLGMKCEGFTIHKPLIFYPVRWQDWQLYFTADNSSEVMSKLSETVGVHVWNNFSKSSPAIKGSMQPYVQLASKYCPKVYSIIPDQVF